MDSRWKKFDPVQVSLVTIVYIGYIYTINQLS